MAIKAIQGLIALRGGARLKRRLLSVILISLGIFISFLLYSWSNETSTIKVSFTDEYGTKLRVKPKTYHSKPYLILNKTKLEKEVPGYTPVKRMIFYKKDDQSLALKFKPENYQNEVAELKKSKYVAATFQPMSVNPKGRYQLDPYNTARTYLGSKTGKDSLRILYSKDGLRWKMLHTSYPKLNIRDPNIIKVKNYWYVIYTKGLVRTKDFKKWEKIPWSHSKTFNNHYEWAPEFFKDASGKYHVVMSGRSAQTGKFQLYVSSFDETTGKIKNDWQKMVGEDFPSNMIDANIAYHNGQYVLFYKNEDVSKNKLTMATSKNYLGPYKSTALNINLMDYDGAEGLESMFDGNKLRLYVDPYKFNNENDSIYNGVHYTDYNSEEKRGPH